MTYNVFGGTLNLTQSHLNGIRVKLFFCSLIALLWDQSSI